jgi:hypothetical protein
LAWIAHAAAAAPACLLLVMTLGIGIGKCVHAVDSIPGGVQVRPVSHHQ